MAEPATALGLMSGTSLDGIDAALLRTDGVAVAEPGPWLTVPYAGPLRERLRAALGHAEASAELVRDLTLAHVDIVEQICSENSATIDEIDVIGFHGHTMFHDPAARATCQIGDGALLAELTSTDVVCDFRSADVTAGGQGAPLAPLYHQCLTAGLERPVAVLNVGGVANVTWIGAEGPPIAFDTGPGNALIDDWCTRHGGEPLDRGGALALSGRANLERLGALLDHPYFALLPPKSLDRGSFAAAAVEGLSAADGAATLTTFTAAAVAAAQRHFPAPVGRWLVAGGGRHNPALMAALAERLNAAVEPVETVAWRGDALEAEAFAFLAVRSVRGLPISLPSTTGVPRPHRGGVLHRAIGRR